MDASSAHLPLVRAVAAYGLAGSMHDLPRTPVSREEFNDLLTQVRMQRLSGLLWTAIVNGALPVTDVQAEQAEWLHMRAMAASLVLERLLLDTVDALHRLHVPVRVLKGSAVAHLDYPDPIMRTFGDVDLLVPGEHFDTAVAGLVERGHERLYPQPRPGFDRRFAKGTSFRSTDGLEIDLHRSFSMGPFGVKLSLPQVWANSAEFTLAGRRLQALGTEERFLHACYHAVLGEVRPRLLALRDVAQIALTRPVSFDRVQTLIRSSGGEAVVSRAVRLAWEAFDIADVLAVSAWAQSYRIDARQAAELAAYGLGSNYTTKSLATLRTLPTLRDRASFFYALVAPNRSYITPRHAGRWSRLRTGIRESAGTRGMS